MRQSKATRQSKLMRFISSPIRTLTKAKNFYMRSLEDCAAKVGYGGGVGGYTASQVPQLPRSFSVNSSSSNDDEDLRQLLRTASSKKNNDAEKGDNKAAGSDMNRRGRPNVSIKQPTMNNGMGMRSYSVGLKMGRIDEERASTFEEDEVEMKADFYTRSRSYAVNKRFAGFV
ncbi:hypothetical protein RchiOBHm_Chr6g0248931 [Rosa chinensis]|uniref:Uncharacterized protein n=1 Tax=Rosa chinensis TaxID=74649 RepID=A0A2P6PK56_ROSCH|nr:uncharacterized protein LOC112170624 [Rosa chinensis]PRQ22314.1 hypothetical protein RchiOBHm_Chr6g0248931 [Rosa chinensis]